MPLLAHFGMGFAAKRWAPALPKWALLVCATGPDILGGVFFFLPIWFHHGLLMDLVWSGLVFLFTYSLIGSNKKLAPDIPSTQQGKRNAIKLGGVAACLFFSHWMLDFIGWPLTVIFPNGKGVPLFFALEPAVGLGVWKTWAGAISMDLGFLLLGILIYMKRAAN